MATQTEAAWRRLPDQLRAELIEEARVSLEGMDHEGINCPADELAADLAESIAGRALVEAVDPHPSVTGSCPLCRGPLFLGSGGYVTCSATRCPDPAFVSKLLGAISTAEGGLDAGEGRVMVALVAAVKSYADLPPGHPREHGEFEAAMHDVQRIIMARALRRQHPEVWR